ncbi:LamG-like jellyroll fold domain-containing protein [Mangrovimonas aestuarii]|uniref:LamG-like jellyroll fold domain-containing protein n=1 Tax=Mangrovimonas aestuarii TaxID=3018443 RepID=UPI0023789C8D|nr:LamG-like jellyroll fold domain-containing protein [Mangrovimonas aestuarii]
MRKITTLGFIYLFVGLCSLQLHAIGHETRPSIFQRDINLQYVIPLVDYKGADNFTSSSSTSFIPTVNCQDITVFLNASGQAFIAEDAVNNGSSGNGALSFDTDITEFDCNDVGTPVMVTLTVTDADGSDSCTATVTILDNLAPIPNVSSLPTINAQCEVTSLTAPTATDNCDGSITAINNVTLPITSQGATIVTWTYTDSQGNSSQQTQNIVIDDITLPTINCPANIEVTNTPTTCAVVVTYAPPVGTDNCSGATTTQTDVTGLSSGSAFPIGVTTLEYTVSDASGNTANCSFTVTVNDAAVDAEVAIDASPSTTICENTSVTFTATPTNGGSAPNYQWYLNGIPVGSNSPTYTNSGLANADIVYVEMTSSLSACGTTVTSNTVTMTVNDERPVSFNISGPNTICNGDSATFSVNPAAIINGSGSSSGFQWTLNGTAISGANSSTYNTSSLTDGDIIDLEVTSFVQCATPVPQTSNNPITVTVNSLPNLTTDDGSVCASNQTSINLNSLVTTDGTTVTFHNSLATANNDTGAINPLVSPTATTTYYVRSEFATGCYVTDTITIDIDSLPTISAGPDQAICLGDSFDLSTIATGSEPLTYHNTQSDANDGINPISPNITPSVTTTYYVRSESASTNCYNTDSVTITVNPLPTLSTIVGSVCANGQSSIDLNSLVTTNGTTVTFHLTQTGADNETGVISAIVSPTSPETYYVRSELATGCYVTDEITITIDPLPQLTTSNGSVCASGQSSINLNDLVNISGGGTLSFYTSETNANNASSAISATVSPTAPTIYWVRSELGTGCYNTTSLQITIDPLPNVVANATSTQICIGDSVTLTGSGASTYSWDNGVSDGIVFSPDSTQDYTVTGTDENGCFNTDTITITVIPDATISLASGNNDQEVCINSNISPIVFNLGGGTTGATFSGLPAGFSGNYNSGANTYTITGATAASGTYNYTVNTTGCGAASSSGTITVFSGPPAAPTEILGVTGICPPTTETYSITILDPSTVTNITWTAPPGFTIDSGQGTEEITLTTGPSATSGNLSVSLSNPCGTDSISIPISVDTYAYVNAGPDQFVCSDQTDVQLAGLIGGVVERKNQFEWSDGGIGGSFDFSNGSLSAQLNPVYLIPDSFSGGVITITISTTGNITNNTCADGGTVIDSMQIFILADPTASISGNTTLCSGGNTNITFTGTPNTTATYNINGGSNQTIAVGGSGISTINTGALTTTTTYNLVSVGYSSSPSCTIPLTESATITVNALNTVEAGGPDTVCQSAAPSPITLSGASFGGDATTAAWSVTSGGGTLSTTAQTPNPQNVTYTPASDFTGTVTLTLTTNAPGSCPAVSDTRTITIEQAPTVEAGNPQDVCAGESIGLSGSFEGSASSVTWSAPSGTFSDASSTNTSYTPSIASGTVILTLTTNDPNGSCTAISDTVEITVFETPTVEAGTNIDVCAGETVSLSGSFGGGASSASWSAPSGSFDNINNTNTEYTPGIASGAVTLTLTTNDPSGPCITVSDTITINVYETPTVDAGSDQTICSNETVIMDATLGGGASSGTWSTSGSGSFNNNTPSAEYTPSDADIANGGVTLTYTTNDPTGPCESDSDTITITVTPAPIVEAGPDQTICSSDTATMNATLEGGASSGTWTSSGTGTFNNNTINAVYSPSPSDINNGSVILTYTTDDPSGPCTAVSDAMTLIIMEVPFITTEPQNVGVCASESASFTVIGIGDNLSFQWYSGTAPGGTPIVSNSNISITSNPEQTSSTLSFAQANMSDADTYYVTISGDASCPTITSAEVTLNVNQEIDITSQPISQTLCQGENVSFIVVADGTITSYQWRKNGVDLTGENNATLTLNNITPSDNGNYDVVISGPGGTCPSATSTPATLTVTPPPTANINYATSPYCDNVSTAQAVTLTGTNAYAGGIYSAPAGLSINASTGAIIPSTSTPGTYLVTYTIPPSGGCEEVPVTTNVTITPLPVANINYDEPAYCETDSSSITVNLTGTDNSGGTYSASPAGLDIDTSTGEISADESDVGDYTVTYTIPASNGCEAVIVSTDISISPLPVATFNYGSTSYCENSSNPLPTFSGGGVAGEFTANSGLAINSSTGEIDLATSTPGSYTVTNTILGVGGCNTVSHSTTINIDEVADGGTVQGTAIGPDGELTTSSVVLVCADSTGSLELTGESGDIIQWEYSTDNGQNWTIINDTSNAITYSGITDTTIYRVLIDSGSCGQTYSALAVISVVPNDLKPDPVTASAYTLCLGESSTLTAESSIANGQFITGGNFQTGQLNTQDPDSWLVDGSPGGWTANGDNTDPPHDWSGTNPHPFGGGVFLDSGDPKFAIADGNITTQLETPIFNTFGLEDAIFEFDYAYVLPDASDYFLVEISIDGGATYLSVPLWEVNGPTASGNYDPFSANHFSYDLSTYPGINLVGVPDLRIRFTFSGHTDESLAAMDGITLPAPPIDNVLVWTELPGTTMYYENIIMVTPPTPGVHSYAVTSYLVNSCGYAITEDNSEFVDLTVYDYDIADAGEDIIIGQAECGVNTVTISATPLTGVTPIPDPDNPGETIDLVSTGEWTVTSGQDPSTYSFADPTAYNTTFTGEEEGPYILTWTVTPPEGSPCEPSTDSISVTLTNCSTLDFDGVDDNVTFRNYYNLSGPNDLSGTNGAFSIELWLKSEASNSSVQTIISKRDATDFTHGYDLRLVNNMVSFHWNNTGVVTASDPISTNRWYHVAITYDGGTYNLYVDGILVGSTSSSSSPIENNFECILGAMDQAATGGSPDPVNYFEGWMDELRIWNTALTVEQIRFMMNQEVENFGGNVRGSVVPIDAPGLTWANFIGYYQMNQTVDIVGGYILPNAGTQDGRMRNITTWQEENAPLPYTSDNNGNWRDTSASSPWLWGHSVWDYPNAYGINGERIDWNIVITSHDIVYNPDDEELQLLGLLVNSNEVTITDSTSPQDETNPGNGLFISHYLKLDGSIDLIGESQLVQKRYTPSQVSESILDVNSGGFVERDQQGISILYNYNYWSSPVSLQNTTPNNADYTVADVLMDGTFTDTPQAITWIGGYDANPGPPIQIPNYWLWTFNALANTYLEWNHVGSTGNIPTGNGYTMKGSGTSGDYQNYVFKGKPHNGSIQNSATTLANGEEFLIGNPYPSAMDADEFIRDNIPGPNANPNSSNAFDGTLYFWVHYLSNNSHILLEYEGGYAAYNLSGGVAPTTPPITNDGYVISNLGTSTLEPGPYIPVAQGFFVAALQPGTGGQIKFENDQRVFERETGSGTSVFLRSANNENLDNTDAIKRIRFNFTTPEGAVKQLLLSFLPNNLASDELDYGYDAPNIISPPHGLNSGGFGKDSDTKHTKRFPSDLNWVIDNKPYIIQGVGDFDKTKKYPMNMTVKNSGNIQIELTSLENFNENINVYVYDALYGTYTLINNLPYRKYLKAEDYNNRFYITFTEDETLNIIEETLNKTIINYLNSSEVIYIKTPPEVNPKQIYLINTLGQTVRAWNQTNITLSNEMRIPVNDLSEGSYIIQLITEDGKIVNKKIVISNSAN